MRAFNSISKVKGLTLKFSLGIFRFVPAGTIGYRQAWIYLFIFAVSVTLITLYLWKNDRELLKLFTVA